MNATMTEATKPRRPRKGDTIFLVDVWTEGTDDRMTSYLRPVVYVQEVRVQSWGKVQATATDAATGEFLRFHLVPGRSGFAWTREECGPMIDAAVAKVRATIRGRAESQRRWLQDYPTARADIRARAARQAAEFEAFGESGEVAAMDRRDCKVSDWVHPRR